MKRFIFSLILICFSLSTYAAVPAKKKPLPPPPPTSGGERYTAKINQQAPDFVLNGHDGNTYSLRDFRGKFVILEWFNHECPYVKKHYDLKASNMQRLQKSAMEDAKKNEKELVWFSIVSSAKGKQGYLADETQAEELKKKLEANMTAILFDPTGDAGLSFKAKTTPHMFIIDPQGIVRYMGGIDDKPSSQTSSLRGAKNYVLAALKDLFAGKKVETATTEPYGCSVKYKDSY